MRQMRQAGSSMRGLGVTAGLALLLLAAAAPASAQEEEHPLPPPVPVAEDALSAALETGELTEAEYALERARSIFQLARVRREFGDVARPAARDATLILRDLAARVDELAGADRAVAKSILARPDDGSVEIGNGWDAPESDSSPSCGGGVCVHWVDETGNHDGPPVADVDPANGIPDWVDLTLLTWEDVWAQEIDTLGYRAPLSDLASANNGGNLLLDVYLEDLGSVGVFGYCTSDDPTADDEYAVSAYCVVDNDFAPGQYGTGQTPQEFLEVTSAHEFHHASQFAYDSEEDYWLMEGTAANIEETVYPAIDDNVSFLRFWSPLSRPSSPLDRGGLGNSEYGSWIFWRFLEEKIAGHPGIVRKIWERADAYDPSPAPGDNPDDDYSLEAARHELTERGLSFPDVFARFATANRLLDYADAEDADYPSTPVAKRFVVGLQAPDTRWRSWKINHLAARFFSFTPGKQVPPDARLRVATRLPANIAHATLIVVEADGSTSTRRLEPNGKGLALGNARFGHRDIKRVEVVLSNGSTRIVGCWKDNDAPTYSCFGRPLDDGRVFELRGRLLP